MVFTEGNIFKFTPFYFSNNSSPKDKFFVVIGQHTSDSDKIILASLPTSKDHIPTGEEVDHGCVELPHANFNCFTISPEITVTTCGKQFPKSTFLEGHNLTSVSESQMKGQYPIEGVNYHIWGQMENGLLSEIKSCFSNSASVKRKYKKMLKTG